MCSPEQLDTIRRLNDLARSQPGTASIANVTLGFQSLPDADRFAALAAIGVALFWVALIRFKKFLR